MNNSIDWAELLSAYYKNRLSSRDFSLLMDELRLGCSYSDCICGRSLRALDAIHQLTLERDLAIADLKGLHDKYGICDYCSNAILETNQCKSIAEYGECRWTYQGVLNK